jgi:hypothetical protein
VLWHAGIVEERDLAKKTVLEEDTDISELSLYP